MSTDSRGESSLLYSKVLSLEDKVIKLLTIVERVDEQIQFLMMTSHWKIREGVRDGLIEVVKQIRDTDTEDTENGKTENGRTNDTATASDV